MKIKYWIILGIILLGLIYGAYYGWKNYRYYQERDSVIERQSEVQKDLETENTRLINEQADYIRRLREKERQIGLLDKRISEIEDERKKIIPPSDPDALCDAFRNLGFSSARRRTVIQSK